MSSNLRGFWSQILLITLVAGSGCAFTDMRSFTDPDFKFYTCSNMLVAAHLPHLDQRAEAEDIFLKEFAGTGMSCRRSVDILPPTRQYEDDEMFGLLRREGICAVLVIRETQYYEDQVYIPQSSTTHSYGNLSANTYYYGNMANTYGSMHANSYTHTSGGYYVNEPRIRHHLELYDVTSRKVVWVGGAFTKGNSKADFKALITALAGETKKMFKKDGLVPAQTAERASR